MDGRSSFRNRTDQQFLALAIAVPWILAGLGWASAVVGKWCYQTGNWSEWVDVPLTVWFYFFGFSSLITGVGLMFLALWRLLTRREYRRSWYGWLSPVVMWLNLCAVTTVIGN